MKKEITLGLLLLGGTSLFGQGTAKIMYTSQDLSCAFSKLSDNAQYATGSQGVSVAPIRWNLNDGTVEILPCNDRGIGMDIADNGMVVGECDNLSVYYDLDTGEAVELSSERGYNGGQAMGITADGSMIVGKVFDKAWKVLPLIWREDDAYATYEKLPVFNKTPHNEDVYYVMPCGMSGDGKIILGNAIGVRGDSYGIIWTAPEYEYKIYGADIINELYEYTAVSVSPDGNWIGGYGTSMTDSKIYCYRYNIPNDKFEIITAKGGATMFAVTGISNNGTMVAYETASGDPMLGRVSYIIEGENVTELGEYLNSKYGVELKEMSGGCSVMDISGDGNTIIGFGLDGNYFESFCIKITPDGIDAVPADYQFTVNGNSLVCPQGTSQVELYDIAGKKIIGNTYAPDYSLNGISSGIYVLQAVVNGEKVVTKIIR